MYANGRGVPQDYVEAVKWYRKAVEQGNAGAQFNLGVMYANGRGVPQDDAGAVGWWRKAAEQDHASAQFNLGVMYHYGQGVPQDDVQAHMRYNLAASRFPPGEDRDTAVNNRDKIAKRMTPAQISEAEKLAREWKPKK
jgi:TPR repeat protein